jgi:hypothetical protein
MSPGKGFLVVLFLMVVPILAWVISRQLLNRGGGFFRSAGDRALAPWEGTYYAFDDTQVRIFEDDGRLWFVAADVARAVGWRKLPQRFRVAHEARLRRVEGTRLGALDMQGLEALLVPERSRSCSRFLVWARNEVEAPWRRKREDSARR